VMLIITMAEEHSLDLILSNWLSFSLQNQQGGDCCTYNWVKSLHIHEVIPTSGKMRPFCFVLQKKNECEHDDYDQNDSTNNWNIIFHHISNSNDMYVAQSDVISIPLHEDPVALASPPLLSIQKSSTSPSPPSVSVVRSIVDDLLKESRVRFHEETQNKMADTRMILGTIEIKPTNHTVDLKRLYDRITASTKEWGIKSLHWYKNGEIANNAPSDLCFGEIVPIGFGIQKLVLRCVIDSDLLENFCEAIMEDEGKIDNSDDDGEEEDCIQSIDIDWENSFVVGDLESILPQN